MMPRVAHEEDRESEPKRGIADAEIERLRPETVALGDVAGEEGGEADGEIAREFVQADGEAARFGADEIDLHDHRHRPGEALVDAEQRVRRDDPAPARPPADHERHRQADEPAQHQHVLAAIKVGEMSRDEIGDRLDDAEADDEGDDNGGRCDLELFGADQRNHRPLQPHHAADEGIDEDEQRELLPVLAQAQPDAEGAGADDSVGMIIASHDQRPERRSAR